MRTLLKTLFSTTMLITAGAAFAQTAPEGAPEAESNPPAESESLVISKIVVTANRREERLQDVPVSVTLVDGSQLAQQNINSVENLTRAAPSLNLAGPSGFGALSIRGIGSLSFSRSSEGSVGTVVDGVALANTSSNPPLLFDIQRVEVLEGPQGMLFGRNASAGVINIVTKAPDPSGFEFISHVSAGSRNNVIARAAVNVPVSENAALRAALSYTQEPEIQQNIVDGSWLQREGKAARLRFLWEPTDTLTINLAGDYNETGADGGVPWAVFSSSPTSLLTARLAACGVNVEPENTEGCINGKSVTSADTFGASAQVDWDIGDLTLTSISAYRGAEGGSSGDVDSTPTNRLVQTVSDEIDNFSQELRLTSPSGGFVEYVAGLYYFQSETANVTTSVGPILADLDLIAACPVPLPGFCQLPLGQTRPTDTETESYAAFGQMTINATDRFRVILGGRVGEEDVSAFASASTTAPGAAAEFGPIAAVNATVSDSYFSYRVGAQYDLTPNVMVYATYAEGYKGAAINDQSPSAGVSLIVNPEKPTSAEIGFKATILGGRMALNATAFQTDVEDFQAQFIDTSGGTPVFVFGNADSFTVKGITTQLLGQPMEGLNLNVGVSYLSSEFNEQYLQFDSAGAIVDVSQLEPDNRFKLTASGEYERSLTGKLDGFIQADAVFSPERYSDAARSPILTIEEGWLVGGRVGVRTSDGRYSVSVFARNIFDEFRSTARFGTPVAQQQLDLSSFSQFSGPEAHRVVGVSIDASF